MKLKETINLMRLQVFKDEFMKVDPYDVIECGLDNFAPYAYVDMNDLEAKYPKVYKEYYILNGKYIDELDELREEFIRSAQGY